MMRFRLMATPQLGAKRNCRQDQYWSGQKLTSTRWVVWAEMCCKRRKLPITIRRYHLSSRRHQISLGAKMTGYRPTQPRPGPMGGVRPVLARTARSWRSREASAMRSSNRRILTPAKMRQREVSFIHRARRCELGKRVTSRPFGTQTGRLRKIGSRLRCSRLHPS